MSETTFGARVLARALKEEGVECLFGIHGTLNVMLEEACGLGIKMYHVRHEQAAGFAADAYARCLRRPGVCFASAAAGFANYVSAIAQAKGALSPVVLLIGQIGAAQDKLDAMQGGHGEHVFNPIAKWTHRCIDWNLNSFWLRKALIDAMHYPPGPIVLEFPNEALHAKGPNRQQKYPPRADVANIPKSQGDPVYVEKVVKMLLEAERPLLIAGDGIYWSDGSAELQEFAELLKVPVSTRRTARGAIPEDHPLAFTPGNRQPLLDNADVVCLVGLKATQLDEWFEPPDWSREAKYIQIQERPEEIWCALPTKVAVVGSSKLVLRQMIDCARSLAKEPVERSNWLDTLGRTRQIFKERQREAKERFKTARPIHPHVLCAEIADFLDPSATIIYDSFTGSIHLTANLEAKFAGQVLDAGLHQALGQGVGMAIGAQIARPGKQVLALVGDGGLGIGGFDIETLVRYKLPAVIVLLNNDSWAGRAAGLDLFYWQMDSTHMTPGIRYDKMFAELGCHTEYVEQSQDIRPALYRAFNSGLTSFITVRSEASEMVPITQRVRLLETWLREDVDQLSEEAMAELRRISPRGVKRTEKMLRDSGVHVPISELAEITGTPIDQVLRWET